MSQREAGSLREQESEIPVLVLRVPEFSACSGFAGSGAGILRPL